jgi:hypothetical protein
MCDCSAPLDTVDESRRRLPIPVFECLFCRKTIKRAVDFYGGKSRRIKLQLSAHRKLRRIKALCPALIGPTACADVNAAGLHSSTPSALSSLQRRRADRFGSNRIGNKIIPARLAASPNTKAQYIEGEDEEGGQERFQISEFRLKDPPLLPHASHRDGNKRA